jgi:hypothetical protein
MRLEVSTKIAHNLDRDSLDTNGVTLRLSVCPSVRPHVLYLNVLNGFQRNFILDFEETNLIFVFICPLLPQLYMKLKSYVGKKFIIKGTDTNVKYVSHKFIQISFERFFDLVYIQPNEREQVL